MHYEDERTRVSTYKKKKKTVKKKSKKEAEENVFRQSIVHGCDWNPEPRPPPYAITHRFRAYCCHKASGTSFSSQSCAPPCLATAVPAMRGLRAPCGVTACTLGALRPGS